MGFLFYMFSAAVAFGGGVYCGMIYAKKVRASAGGGSKKDKKQKA